MRSPTVSFHRFVNLLKFRSELNISAFVFSTGTQDDNQSRLFTSIKNSLSTRRPTVFTKESAVPHRRSEEIYDGINLSTDNKVAQKLFRNGFSLEQLLKFIREHGNTSLFYWT